MALNNSDTKRAIEHFPQVLIEVVTSDKMRYKTLGDWFYNSVGEVKTLFIKVLKQEGPQAAQKEYLIALHEFIEAMHCSFQGISQKQVDDFDMNNSEEKIHNDGWPEHGFHPSAPYLKQHGFAFLVEQQAARELNLSLGSLVYGDFYSEN